MAQLPAAPVLYTPETHLSTADINRIADAVAAKLEDDYSSDYGSLYGGNNAPPRAAIAYVPPVLPTVTPMATTPVAQQTAPVVTREQLAVLDTPEAKRERITTIQTALKAGDMTAFNAAVDADAAVARARAQVSIDALKAENKARLKATRQQLGLED